MKIKYNKESRSFSITPELPEKELAQLLSKNDNIINFPHGIKFENGITYYGLSKNGLKLVVNTNRGPRLYGSETVSNCITLLNIAKEVVNGTYEELDLEL